jgi:hypothetical protein
LGVMAGGKSGRRGRLVLVVLLFGGILAAGRLVPAVRWFFRQRADRSQRRWDAGASSCRPSS